LARVFELSQIKDLPKKSKIFLPRFRDIANYLEQPNVDLDSKFKEIKGSSLTPEEKKLLGEREKYARIWLEKYAPEEFKNELINEIPQEVKLENSEKEFLGKVADLVESEKNPEKLQQAIYNLSKDLKLNTKKAFEVIYQVLIGKDHGPKAAWFLLSLPREKVIKRLKEASK